MALTVHSKNSEEPTKTANYKQPSHLRHTEREVRCLFEIHVSRCKYYCYAHACEKNLGSWHVSTMSVCRHNRYPRTHLERVQAFALVAFDFQQSGGNIHEAAKDLCT